eukprot:GHVR01103960.1.p1 GENE.GHVR01103960.1~~GHVR01103960.1.p1  ORF type:complete len:431 (-),score=80.82 GHVR01103960.1:364-1656(-)
MEDLSRKNSVSQSYMERAKQCSQTDSNSKEIKPTKIFSHHSSAVDSVQWIDDTSFVSASHDHTLCIWNIKEDKPTKVLKGHVTGVYHVSVSPDKKYIVSCGSGDDKNLLLWDTKSGVVMRALEGHKSNVYHASFSPKSDVIISGNRDGTVKLHDVSSSDETASVQLHNDAVTCTSFCFDTNVPPESPLAAISSRDGAVSILDVRRERTGYMRISSAHGGCHVNGVVFIDKFTIITCGADYLIKRFDLRLLQDHSTISGGGDNTTPTVDPIATQVYEGHTNAVRSISVACNGKRFASCCSDGSIRVWATNALVDIEEKLDSKKQQTRVYENELERLESEHCAGHDVDVQLMKDARAHAEASRLEEAGIDMQLECMRNQGQKDVSYAKLMLAGHKDQVSCCAWSHSNEGTTVLTSSWDQKIIYWALPDIDQI